MATPHLACVAGVRRPGRERGKNEERAKANTPALLLTLPLPLYGLSRRLHHTPSPLPSPLPTPSPSIVRSVWSNSPNLLTISPLKRRAHRSQTNYTIFIIIDTNEHLPNIILFILFFIYLFFLFLFLFLFFYYPYIVHIRSFLLAVNIVN